jgi:hypothetical protein
MKSRLLVLLLLVLFTSTGCAFAGIGAGIGAAIPKTETVTRADTDALGGEAHVETSERTDALAPQHVAILHVAKERTEVKKHKGNHWLTGFLVGGAVDLVLGSVLAYLAVQSFGAGLGAMGGM